MYYHTLRYGTCFIEAPSGAAGGTQEKMETAVRDSYLVINDASHTRGTQSAYRPRGDNIFCCITHIVLSIQKFVLFKYLLTQKQYVMPICLIFIMQRLYIPKLPPSALDFDDEYVKI